MTPSDNPTPRPTFAAKVSPALSGVVEVEGEDVGVGVLVLLGIGVDIVDEVVVEDVSDVEM